jgi:hypothetical protein
MPCSGCIKRSWPYADWNARHWRERQPTGEQHTYAPMLGIGARVNRRNATHVRPPHTTLMPGIGAEMHQRSTTHISSTTGKEIADLGILNTFTAPRAALGQTHGAVNQTGPTGTDARVKRQPWPRMDGIAPGYPAGISLCTLSLRGRTRRDNETDR